MRQRLVEIDANPHAARFGCDLKSVAEVKGRESKVGSEPVVLLVGVTPFESRHQVPLLGRWHQPHVAVRGDALAVKNHLHGRVLLVYEDGVVGAVVEKYAKTLSIEVILVGHLQGKIGAEKAWTGGQGQEETHYD